MVGSAARNEVTLDDLILSGGPGLDASPILMPVPKDKQSQSQSMLAMLMAPGGLFPYKLSSILLYGRVFHLPLVRFWLLGCLSSSSDDVSVLDGTDISSSFFLRLSFFWSFSMNPPRRAFMLLVSSVVICF